MANITLAEIRDGIDSNLPTDDIIDRVRRYGEERWDSGMAAAKLMAAFHARLDEAETAATHEGSAEGRERDA